jgi:hypothetical protein
MQPSIGTLPLFLGFAIKAAGTPETRDRSQATTSEQKTFGSSRRAKSVVGPAFPTLLSYWIPSCFGMNLLAAPEDERALFCIPRKFTTF